MSPNINKQLFIEIKNNNDALVIELLRTKNDDIFKNKLDINWKNPNINENPKGNTLLIQSLKTKSVNYNIVNALLQNGADPNIPDNLGNSPLNIAVYSGIPSIVDLLLQKGANPNIPDNLGKRPLNIAVHSGIPSIVDLLLQKGADPNIPDNLGKRPLNIAVHSGIPSIVDLLLQKGADPNYESKSLGLPLIDALMLHNTSNDNIIEIVELLLKSDADVNLTNNKGETFITSFYKMNNNELKTKLTQKKTIS